MCQQSLIWTIVIALFVAFPAFPSDRSWWKISLAAMATSNTADTVASMQAQGRVGCREENVLYGHCFGARAISLKVVYVGANVVVQSLLVKRHTKLAKWFALGNVSQSVAPAWSVWHNSAVQK